MRPGPWTIKKAACGLELDDVLYLSSAGVEVARNGVAPFRWGTGYQDMGTTAMVTHNGLQGQITCNDNLHPAVLGFWIPDSSGGSWTAEEGGGGGGVRPPKGGGSSR